ncbi:VWA domain-containing protein [Actinocatenispora sera]|uniref:vWA domain-containing protein n=1 Tax=Actinocatenispora sera TaxID=390989 RepID=UPI00340ABA3A
MSSDPSFRYSRFLGGPDPLAPPYDPRAALDAIGDDVLAGASPSAALRELLRRGLGDRTGLDELSRQVHERRRELRSRYRLDGTLRQVDELLRQALADEREALAAERSDDARFREMQLDALPSDTAGAVRELAGYDWRSAEGAAAYAEIQRLLGRELLDQRFAGIRDAMRQVTDADVARVADMLADLNALLSAHARNEPDIDRRFAEFMDKHGEFFPERPGTIDELIESLAQRSAQASRLLNSLTEQQRAELAELSAQAFGDPRIGAALSQLDAQLQALRPDLDWSGGAEFDGDQPLGLGQASRAMGELADLDALAEQLAQAYPGAQLSDIDLEALERTLGPRSVADARRLAELEQALRADGLFERAADGSLRLSPRALRRLGETALRDVARQLSARGGQRDTRLAGAAGEPTGASREWRFGDTEPWDVPRTLGNAVLRRAADPTDDAPFALADVAITETEARSRAAVALCVDTSWSMVAEGRWVPMKRTALALHQLVRTRFRTDALELITFGRLAQTVSAEELVGLDGAYEQGTNLHHALLLAGRHLRKHPDAQPVLLVVTDGEPTARLTPDGEGLFDYPPDPETLRVTVAELDHLGRLGAAVTVFMLGEDPSLRAFVDLVARRTGGRVVAPDPDGLGAAVVSDYLRSRRRS